MIPESKQPSIFLLVSDKNIRNHISNLLKQNHYQPTITLDQEELVRALKKEHLAIVLADSKAVSLYGAGIYTKIKAACMNCKIILLGNRAYLRNKSYRNLIKEAMDLGVYGCILSPYEEWEVLSMIKYILMKENAKIKKS